MHESPLTFWPLTGKLLLTACYLIAGTAMCFSGLMMGMEGWHFADYYPDLPVAVSLVILGAITFGASLLVWSSYLSFSRVLGAVICVAAVWIIVGSLQYRSSSSPEVIAIPITALLVLLVSGLFFWMNEAGRVGSLPRWMPIVILGLNFPVAAGGGWVMATATPRGHMDLSGIFYALLLFVQLVWVIVLAISIGVARHQRKSRLQ